MPHIEISHHPRHLSEQDKKSLAEALCHVVSHYLGTSKDSTSMALIPVEKELWTDSIVKRKILPCRETMILWPTYLAKESDHDK